MWGRRCGAQVWRRIAATILVTGLLAQPLATTVCGQTKNKPGANNSGRRPGARKTTAGNNGRNKRKPEEDTEPVVRRTVVIKPVNPNAKYQVKASAKRIDELVEAGCRKQRVELNPITTDAEFLRRVYLDVAGTIPTYQQVNRFMASTSTGKRAQLIDKLLNSRAYASNFYNYWGDLLRVTDRLQNQVPAAPFNEWIKVSLETNKPYDQFVYEMLAATGKVTEQPAVGYLIRDTGMPLDNMNNTIRVFLGTQIGCAQCHDHPFDRWTQKEFYEIAAFTFGTATRVSARDKMFGRKNVVQTLRGELAKLDSKSRGGAKYNRMLVGNLFQVRDTKRRLKFPTDYAYDNGKANQVVKPKTLFGDNVRMSAGDSPREIFAKWLTSRDNPRFALAISNRLWKKLMGVGLIDPVDDIRDESVASNEPLMKYLTSEMIRLNFDMKEYLRIVLNSETYQRQATREEIPMGEPYYFPGPILRRMTAEQVWDSFITLATFNPDHYQMPPAKQQSELMSIDLKTIQPQEIIRRYDKMKELSGQRTKKNREKDHRYKGLLLVRASELPLPAPADHFLRQFGQSDRELIQGSSTDGSVPQVLQMFNGPITHMLLESGSLMHSNVVKKTSLESRVDVIFKSILSRRPTAADMKIALSEIKAKGPAGYGNVIWALVNTREFLFIR